MGWWNYRVMKRLNSQGKYDYGIHEVYYDDDGKINGWTEDSMVPVCPSEKDILYELEVMKRAFEQETLLYEETFDHGAKNEAD